MNEWNEIDRGRKRCVVTHKRSSHVFVSHPLLIPQWKTRWFLYCYEQAVQTSGTAQLYVNILLFIRHDAGQNIEPKRKCRSQWPRGLRRRSAAARLMGLWVRIPPRTWMFVVSVVCCQVEVSATSWSLVQRSPTECSVSEYDRGTSQRTLKSLVLLRHKKKKKWRDIKANSVRRSLIVCSLR